jgi:hypothetical protein
MDSVRSKRLPPKFHRPDWKSEVRRHPQPHLAGGSCLLIAGRTLGILGHAASIGLLGYEAVGATAYLAAHQVFD